MPLRNGIPISWKPKGASDTVDATNAFPGAMQLLSNLIPDPLTDNMWIPRPASIEVTDFTGVPGGAGGYGFISALLVVGDFAYGMIASARNANHDEPFLYHLSDNTFHQVSGITSGNTPVSPATTGDWTPPQMAQVGSRIIVTHPGFPGGTVKFGWFDISGASISTTGNTNTNNVITGNPSILGVQPGMTISAGADIPANTTVVSTQPFVLVESGATHSNTTLDGLASTTGLAVGQEIAGAGIPTGTTITVVGAGSVTMSQAATATATVTVTFSGATITMSAAATGSTSNLALTIDGGTQTNPLWGAGDTDRNPLPSVPVDVAQFNGRAYYALGLDGIVYSDSGFPCRVSNTLAVQALTTNDGLAITCIGALQLSSLLGGAVQSLIAFQGIAKMQQITGDQSTNNLAMNSLPTSTGTLAPLSVVSCEKGLAFVSPEGLRIITFAGTVSEPVGDHGTGVTSPFIYSVYPSRICAAARVDTIRISTQNGLANGSPMQEWWYDLTRRSWSGPHTFPADQIQPFATGFLLAANGVTAKLWSSNAYPFTTSTFIENGQAMTAIYRTSLLPDNNMVAENAVILTTLSGQFFPGVTTITALDEADSVIDQTTIVNAAGSNPLWGTAVWNAFNWGAVLPPFRQVGVYWTQPLVFKQASFQVVVNSELFLRIGTFYMLYQRLGYMIEEVA